MTEYAKEMQLKPDRKKYKTLMQVTQDDNDRVAYIQIYNLIERILKNDKERNFK